MLTVSIQPEDLVRQSMPFSYLYVTAKSNDGDTHNVRLYSDITGGNAANYLIKIRFWLTDFVEFLQANSGVHTSWANQDDGTNIILSEQLVERMAFTEVDDRAADAVEYYCHKRASLTSAYYISVCFLSPLQQSDQRNHVFLANFIE